MVASQEYTYVVRYLPNPCERYNFKARDIKNTIHAGDIAALQGYGIIIVKCRKSQKLPCGRNAAIPGSSEVAFTSARRPTDCCISRGVQQASR
jgi:hypothetical protein